MQCRHHSGCALVVAAALRPSFLPLLSEALRHLEITSNLKKNKKTQVLQPYTRTQSTSIFTPVLLASASINVCFNASSVMPMPPGNLVNSVASEPSARLRMR